MTLTLAHGPLSAPPPETVNYRIEGPEHRLFFDGFPRRMRAVLAGETVADTTRGMLLHETGLLPVLYYPEEDVRDEMLEPAAHTTRCPFKGTASYWTAIVGDRVAANAVWSYLEPPDSAKWLRGYRAIDWDAMDEWFDEDERIEGHLRDPYHRVDVRASSRHVRILLHGAVVTETRRPKVLSETGVPNRFYIPPEDVEPARLEPSRKRTVCPYKGRASYWSLRVGDMLLDDAAWSYESPLENASKVAGHVCFLHDDLDVEVDGHRVP